MTTSRNALPSGYQIHWYVISKILGQGGFGITYLAEDSNLGRDVAIKEYLPTGMAIREGDDSVQPVTGEHGEQYRWGLDRFISEAQTLARFKHKNIVHVYSVFSENNTAYMVMVYEKGRGLDVILKEQKTLSEDEINTILHPLLEGLEQVHEFGFIHRDIKPANIFIREDNTPVLLDFGSARQSLGEHTQNLTAMVSPGFAPFEQYSSKGDKQGPWTDIYGLGATLYRAVIGRSPPNAMDRSESLLQHSRDNYVPINEMNPAGYSPALIAAIDTAMNFKTTDRPQSISAWRDIFSGVTLKAPTIEDKETEPYLNSVIVDTHKPTIKISNQEQKPVVANSKSSFAWRTVTVTLILLFAILFTSRAINRNEPVSQSQPTTTKSIQPTEDEEIVSLNINELEMLEGNVRHQEEEVASTIENPAPISAIAGSPPIQQQGLISPQIQTDLIPTPPSDAPTANTPQRRLESDNAQLPETDRNPRAVLNRYENRIREAIRNKNYAEAERHLEAMQKVAPNNQRIKEYLDRIRNLQRTQ